MSERLEVELGRLAGLVEWPESDLTRAVLHGIDRQQGRSGGRWPAPRWVGALAVVVVVLAVSVTPAGRRAVADLLGVIGIDIEMGVDPAVAVGAGLKLGGEVDLGTAGDGLGFQPLVPDLGDPDAVYLSTATTPVLSMVWEPDAHLVEAADTGVAVLFSQFLAEEGDEVLAKQMGGDTEIRVVSVQGVEGVWIEGAPHVLIDQTGVDEYARLAANVLAWHRGGVTYRLELAGPLDLAQEIAATLRPADPFFGR